MADFSVIHAYLCGHFDSNPMPGASGPQYVFANSGCSNYECSHTDIDWFKEQGTTPTSKAVSQLTKFSKQLTELQTLANKYALGLALAEPFKLEVVASIGFPSLKDVAFADEPQQQTNDLFHIDTIKSLLRFARQFAKSSKTKPFFDFCMGELGYFITNALNADNEMLKALRASDMIENNATALASFRQWPGSHSYHEPGFGRKDLEILRSAGKQGEDILAQPLNAGTLHVAALLVRTLAADQQHYAPATPLLVAAPRSKTIALASSSNSDLDLIAFIEQEEKAFVAELKATAAKKARRAGRQNRINTLSCVGTAMGVSKRYLPTLVRCA